MKREGEEYKSVVDACMMLCGQHGITVNLPWELTQVLEKLLQAKAAAQVNPAMAVNTQQQRVNNLRQLVQGNNPAQPTQQSAPMQAPPPPTSAPPIHGRSQSASSGWGPPQADPFAEMEQAEPVDPWANMSHDVDALFREEKPVQQHVHQTAPEEQQMPLDQAEMMRRYKAGQDKMLNRVATEGVQYKNGGGPAQGKVLTPAEGVPAPSTPPPGPTPQRNNDGPRMKGGMTREEALDMIERASGHRPRAPEGNPVPKPPGF